MSLAGSSPRSLLLRLFGRRVPRTAPARRPRRRARDIARDFALWESEVAVGRGTVEVAHPPIEQVAAHLRRLRAVLDALPPDVSFVRWEGVLRAYDDVLGLACRELEVPTDLLTIGFGRHRDEERVRLERLLDAAGLPVR